MNVIRCRFEIQGDPLESCETGITVDVEIPLPVTLEMVKDAFPFEGVYFFRHKIYNKSQNWAWADLLPGELKVSPSAELLEIRVGDTSHKQTPTLHSFVHESPPGASVKFRS